MQGIDSDLIRKVTTALEGMREFVFLETCRPSKNDNRSFLFTDPICRLECTWSDNVNEFLNSAELYSKQGYFLAGWFEYEFGYLLEPALKRLLWPGKAGKVVARLGVFEKPLIFDHLTGRFVEGNDWPKAESTLSTVKINNLKTNISRQEFLADVEKIGRYIKAGDTYQVNYTFKLDFSFVGSPAVLYRQLRRNQSVAYGAWIRSRGLDIMSFSPELFFSSKGNSIRVRPMKGTLVRGRNVEEDRQMSARLSMDGKSRSENVMIVDLLRNDLSRLLNNTGGGVVKVQSLFDVEVYESLLQMTSTIEGIANPSSSIGLADMLSFLFPCGSVTGAPKIRTMEIIRELEKEPRNVYCGALGYYGSGRMCFNVPIRTLTLADGRGSMGIGAGIVHDSDPESEWRECLLKANFLTRSRPEFQLIETLCWLPDRGFLFLQEHLERLASSAEYFFFQMSDHDVRCRLEQVAEQFSDDCMRVRLLAHKDGRVEVTSSKVTTVSGLEKELPAVSFSACRVDADDVFFFHKTTHRPLYNRERQRAVDQ
ncbi:MAG TPA: aminodeoxychorismate synthase, component I, partial [Desulfobulbaceae bacterium]|nr:aminodeoxychorismate synthase, component I [Desulfobulbaceae bacterium]